MSLQSVRPLSVVSRRRGFDETHGWYGGIVCRRLGVAPDGLARSRHRGARLAQHPLWCSRSTEIVADVCVVCRPYVVVPVPYSTVCVCVCGWIMRPRNTSLSLADKRLRHPCRCKNMAPVAWSSGNASAAHLHSETGGTTLYLTVSALQLHCSWSRASRFPVSRCTPTDRVSLVVAELS